MAKWPFVTRPLYHKLLPDPLRHICIYLRQGQPTHPLICQFHLTIGFFTTPGNEFAASPTRRPLLQTPTGDLLPFFITYTNGITDYLPYPGVTADLFFDGALGEFVVLGFNQTEYHFNEAGQLVELMSPDGNSINFVYENGRLTTAMQGTRFLSYAYDAQGYLQTVTDYTGRSVQLGYTNGNLTTFTNALGATTHYSYTNELLTQIEDPSGRIVETVLYDDQGRAYHLEDGSGRVLTDIEYAVAASNGLTQNGDRKWHHHPSQL